MHNNNDSVLTSSGFILVIFAALSAPRDDMAHYQVLTTSFLLPQTTSIVCSFFCLAWLGMALDLRLKGCGFDPRPFRFQVTTLGKLFTHMCLYHQAV